MSIYFIRHQARGVVWEFPFAASPSDAQIAAVTAHCERSHGAQHPKTGEPHWVAVVEVDMLDPGDLPPAPEERSDGDGVPRIGVKSIEMSGRAHVENPKG